MANDYDSWDYGDEGGGDEWSGNTAPASAPADQSTSAGGFNWQSLVTGGLELVTRREQQNQALDLQRLQLEQQNNRYIQTRDGRVIRAGVASAPAPGGSGAFGLSPLVLIGGAVALVVVLLLVKR